MYKDNNEQHTVRACKVCGFDAGVSPLRPMEQHAREALAAAGCAAWVCLYPTVPCQLCRLLHRLLQLRPRLLKDRPAQGCPLQGALGPWRVSKRGPWDLQIRWK